MATNKQRREAARRHLERQLQRRQQREAARKRFTMIASIGGSIVLIVVIVVAVVLLAGGSDDTTQPAANSAAATPTGSTSAGPTTPAPTTSSTAPPIPMATGPAVTFGGVTVTGAKDLTGMPKIASKHSDAPAKLEYKDLVVGKGKAATAKSTVTVQHEGALYKDGTVFDSSWSRGQTAQFPLSGVVAGFRQGIGGTEGVPPMKVGGRRLIIMPAALGYGANPQPGSGIPKNAPLIFVVDLKKVG